MRAISCLIISFTAFKKKKNISYVFNVLYTSETVDIPVVYLESMILFSLTMINLKYPDVYNQNENKSPKFKDETGMWFHC